MTSKKIFLALVLGVGLTHWGCNPREADASQVSYEGGIGDVSATDRAETTVANTTDTAALILPADTAGINKQK